MDCVSHYRESEIAYVYIASEETRSEGFSEGIINVGSCVFAEEVGPLILIRKTKTFQVKKGQCQREVGLVDQFPLPESAVGLYPFQFVYHSLCVSNTNKLSAFNLSKLFSCLY